MKMKNLAGMLLLIGLVVIAGCFSFPGRVKDPVFTPAPGSFQTSVTVTITSPTTGAQIRYTTDGTTPTETSALYSSPLTFTQNTNLKAMAFKNTLLPSNVVSGTYAVTTPTPTAVAPTFNPVAGTYQNSVNVTMSTPTPLGQIRFTTNGAEPTSTSTLYTGQLVQFNQTTTLKAKTFATGYNPSKTTTATYTITTPPLPTSPVSRSFSTSTIASNGIVNVSLIKTLTSQQTALLIEETVPTGWTIISGGTGSVQGNIIRWAELTGATSGTLSYTVRAPSTTGTGTWSGQYSINGANPVNIGGSTTVTVN